MQWTTWNMPLPLFQVHNFLKLRHWKVMALNLVALTTSYKNSLEYEFYNYQRERITISTYMREKDALQTTSDNFRPFQTISDHFRPFQTISDHFTQFHTISDYFRQAWLHLHSLEITY